MISGKKGAMARMRKLGCMALALAALVSAAGCAGGAVEEEDISGQVQAFYDSIVRTGGDTQGNENIVVGSVNMGMNGEWFAEVMNGIRDAGRDLNVKLEMLDSESDLDKEKANIDELFAKGIDVLVISPISYDVTAESLKKVKDAGIPIITWNTTVDMDVTAEVGVDSTALGGDTGDYVVEYIKTGSLSDVKLYLLTNTSYEIGIARCDGFKSAIQSLVDEGIVTVVADEDLEARDLTAEAAAKTLSAHPEINMIWAWNQSSLLGVIDAVKAAGKKDIVVMGTDMSMDLANDMLQDEVSLQAVTTQLPYNMGYMSIVNAVKAAKGQEVDKRVLIPLSTVKKSDRASVEQYIENHKDLVNE